MLSDVLDSLPSCFVLPFGGMSCSSLALFSAFCWALRSRAGLARDGKHIRMGDGCLLSVLPSILNDPAPRAALLGIWAQRFRAQMTDFMSRLTGVPPHVGRTPLFSIDGHMQRAEHRTRLLDTLVPIVEETVMDLWLVHRCQEKMTFSHHQYEREYVGTYSTIREASRESAEAFNKQNSWVRRISIGLIVDIQGWIAMCYIGFSNFNSRHIGRAGDEVLRLA